MIFEATPLPAKTSQGNAVAQEIVNTAIEKKLRICSAESMTGGRIAAELTGISGASNIFFAGGIFYDERAKIDTLGVSKKTIQKFGIYSTECAAEMAKCWREKCKADICISTTGIAEESQKETPFVFVGISSIYGEKTVQQTFSGNRIEVQTQATLFALLLLKEEILKDQH